MSTRKLIEIKIRLGQDQQAQHELDEYISMMMLNQDLDAVLDYVGNLVMEYPDRVFLRDKKAAIHLELGQKSQAIEEYDKVGELLLDSGNRQGAIEAIEKILALNPSNRDQYQDLVDQLSEDN
jgi:tetratricopeptide (TPR) repeat protein